MLLHHNINAERIREFSPFCNCCVIFPLSLCFSGMAPVDPREVLKEVENFLGKDGELRSLEGVTKIFG